MATDLLRDVRAPLQGVAQRLAVTAPATPAELLVLVRTELDRLDDVLEALMNGVAPEDLGGGGLRVALRRLADRCAVPVTLSAPDDATGDRQAEVVVFCGTGRATEFKHVNS